MSRKDIEARLDRSLENQIAMPRLDRRFDAAVWARIEAAESKATNPVAAETNAAPSRAERASRWIAITNYVGIAATLVVVLFFVARNYGGFAPSLTLDMNISTPVITDDMVTRITAVLGQVLGFVALAFGLSFTSVGRRLRASFF